MIRLTLKIDGMTCGMCESHINDAIRRRFSVKKVTSSRAKGETVVLAETDLPDDALRDALEPTGYRVLAVTREPYEKRGLLSFLRK